MENVGELGKKITTTDRKKKVIEALARIKTEKELELLEEKERCPHGILILLGDEPFPVTQNPKQVYACLECGTTFTYPNNDPKISEVIKNARVLDFSKNPASFYKRGINTSSEYIIITAIRKLIVETAKANPDMSIEELIATIPEDWYTNPNAFDTVADKLNRK